MNEVMAAVTAAVAAALSETWTDLDGTVRRFDAARDGDIAAGNCVQINGDLASYLAEAGLTVALVDLARAPWEPHTVAQVITDDGPLFIDAAWSQFGYCEYPRAFEDWPIVMSRDDYLESSGFSYVAQESVGTES